MHLIFLSFIASLVGIITFISFSPYVVRALTSDQEIIGIAGTYDYNNIPPSIKEQISNSLLHINEKGEIVPILAESWERLDDGKEYRFYLRKDLSWTDGTPLTAQNLQYSFKDVQVEAIDDHIISFKLSKPLAIFPTFLTEPVIKYPLNGVAGLYDIGRINTEFGNITEIELTPNKPGHPVYQYKFFDSETKLIDAYKLGEITEMQTTNKKIADIFQSWNNTAIESTVDYTQLATLFFNTEHPLLQEKDFRQAVAHSISNDIYEGNGKEAIGPVPPTSWAYNPETKRIEHNPQLSEKLIENYSEGLEEPISLTISTFYDNLPIAEEIQKSLQDVGIDSEVTIFSFNRDTTFDMLVAFWNVPQDPDQYFFWHSTQKEGNITRLKNVKIDKLLEDGRSTLSVDDRKEIYFQFQKVMMDEVPAHFLFYPYQYSVTRSSGDSDQ
jgi:peptide/nickel transport system substrate-binding protein